MSEAIVHPEKAESVRRLMITLVAACVVLSGLAAGFLFA